MNAINLNGQIARVSLNKQRCLIVNGKPRKKMPERSNKMERPIISCDVSKGNSHIQGFIGLSNPISDPFVVRHIKSELKQIKELAKSLEKQTHQKPVFVFEYTGIYHECISKYVSEIGLEQYAISPLESAKVRKSKIRTTKTDSRDCLNVATVFYTREIRKYQPDGSDIKALSRYRKFLNKRLTREKGAYHRYVDLIWPCFDEFFKVDGKIAMTIISTYKHPSVLKRRTSKQIAEILANHGHCAYKRGLTIADRLKEYANDCVSSVNEQSEYVQLLNDSIHRVASLQKTIDETNNKMNRLLRKNATYQLIKTVPGIGENLSLVIAAELGDFSRFKTSKQLVAYCGLDPSILQSGKDDGEHYSITRKGNSILRSSLFLAVIQTIKLRVDNQITRFYFKKKSSGLSHKVAAVASCRKLLCCMFGMLTTGVCFETK